MKIRNATRKDPPTLVELNGHVQRLHAKAHPGLFVRKVQSATLAAAFRRMLRDPAAVWLIAEEETPCGYLYAQFSERPKNCFRHAISICNICHLAVRPSSRRKGVAGKLLAHLRTLAAEKRCERIELDVWSFNGAAKSAFRKLGFEVFNERMVLR